MPVLHGIIVNVVDSRVEMGFTPHTAVLATKPNFPPRGLVFAVHLKRGAAMQLADLLSESFDVVNPDQDVIVI